MEERNYTVYKHTSPSGKVYIGITKQKEPEMRWKNGNSYKKNQYFYNAIQKYGWSAIQHQTLFTNLTKAEAEQKEVELIALYKSNQRKFGYNVESGGHVNKVNEKTKKILSEKHKGKHFSPDTEFKKGHTISEETKRKIRTSMLGKNRGPMSEKTKEKLSIAKTGKKLGPPSEMSKEKNRQAHLGKHPSEETRKKMSEAKKGMPSPMKGRHLGPMSEEIKKKMSKPVVCVETGIVYFGSNEAAKQTGINQSHISNVCNNKRKTAGGLHWKFYE